MNRPCLLMMSMALLLFASSACKQQQAPETSADATVNIGDPDAASGGCTGAILDASSAAALENVRFEIEGSQQRNLGVWFYWDESNRRFPGLVFLPDADDEDQRLSVKLPPHPDGLDGGSLKVQFHGDDGLICPAVSIEIEEIATANTAGERERLLTAMQRDLDAQAALFGLTREDLIEAHRVEDLTTFQQMIPGPATPLVLAQYGLDHPDNPTALTKVLRGEDPVSKQSSNTQEVLEGIDALLAHADIVEQLERQAEVMASLPPLELVSAADDPGIAAASLETNAFKVDVADAEALRVFLEISIDRCGFLKTFYGDSVTVAGLTSSGNPVVDAIASGYALTGTVITETSNMICKLFPGRLINLVIEDGNVDVLEDAREFDFEQRLAIATVDARSRGNWNPAAAAFVLGLQSASTAQAAGFSLKLGKAKSADDAVDGAVDVGNKFADEAIDAGATAKSAADSGDKAFDTAYGFFKNSRDLAIGSEVGALDRLTEMGDVGPYYWRGFDIRDNKYITMLSENGRFREFTCGEQRFCFVPVRRGEEVLTFMPDIQMFPAEDLPQEIRSGYVRPVVITTDPGRRLTVTPGEKITIAYNVDADHPIIEWSNTSDLPGPFDVTDINTITEEKQGRVTFTVPHDTDAFPILIEAKHIAMEGLLDNPSMPRPRTFIAIDLDKEFSLAHDETCVEPGQQVQIEAIYDREAHPHVVIDWEVSGGDITVDGLWTAPSRRQVHTIDATLRFEDGRELAASTELLVGECTCWYSVTASFEGQRFSHLQEYGVQIARERPGGLEPLPGYGLYFYQGSSLTSAPIFSVFLDDWLVETAPAVVRASELLLPPSYHSQESTDQWVADGEKSWIRLLSSEPYLVGDTEGDDATRIVEGRGFSMHPYRDASDRVKHIVMEFQFQTILEQPACFSEASHFGWKSMKNNTN